MKHSESILRTQNAIAAKRMNSLPVPSLEEKRILRERFWQAVDAVASSQQKGHITDEEADLLIKRMYALLVEIETNSLVNTFINGALSKRLAEIQRQSDAITTKSLAHI